jgi:hypothetical protein
VGELLVSDGQLLAQVLELGPHLSKPSLDRPS